MIDFLIKKTKDNPRFFNTIKNNIFLMKRISRFLLLRFVMIRGWLKLSLLFIYHTICYYILKIRRDVSISIAGVNIIMPNHMKAIDGAIEIMYDRFYDNIQWFDFVLDLGGYIWESAIRLAQMNNQVIVYEAHPENYNYLLKNIHWYPNISSHNKAVVGTDQSSMIFYGWAFDMGAWRESTGNKKSSKVSCINIINILQSHHFDAMKMDIEWSEYECMHNIIASGKELFSQLKAGIIEFHFYGLQEKINQTKDIINWIVRQGYHVDCFDAVSNKKIQLSELSHFEIIFIYFVKNNNEYKKSN